MIPNACTRLLSQTNTDDTELYKQFLELPYLKKLPDIHQLKQRGIIKSNTNKDA